MPRVTGWRPCRWLGVAVTAAASAWAAEVRALRAAGGWRLEARARRAKAVRWRLSAARRASWVRALCASGPRECASAPLVACDRGRLRTFRTAWFCQNAKPNATASTAAQTINRMRSSSTWARSGRRASWLMALAIMGSEAPMLVSRSRAMSPNRRRLFARGLGGLGQWRLCFVAHRVLELPESLAQRPARVGQPLGSEEDERDGQQDDQVGGLEDSGEHESCPFVKVVVRPRPRSGVAGEDGAARRPGAGQRRLPLPAP